MLENDAYEYLACVGKVENKKWELGDMPIVKEFPQVFLRTYQDYPLIEKLNLL